jgi:transposase
LIKKDVRVNAKGQTRTQIRVVESYRPGKGLDAKQRTVKDFGCLEDQADPDSFMEMVKEFNKTYREQNTPLRIEATGTARMYEEENLKQNYGYKFLEAVYNMLHIDEFIDSYLKTKKFRGDYSPAEIFKFLVLMRLMSPDSKRASFQMKNGFYEIAADFDLPDVYKSLSQFAGFEIELQRHLNEMVKSTIGRDLSHAFYDVTNYYFEIDCSDGEDDLRRRGVSKEHRVDPIVAMGLFLDGNGLPVSMSVFPGNTSESLTLQPTMENVKNSYGLGRLVVVADKGINSSKNINTIVNAKDGFVFSQILKGKKGQRYHNALFDEDGWETNADGTYRYKMFEEEYKGKDKDDKEVIRKRKVLLYWSQDDANRAYNKREEKLKKAAKSVKNNAYSIKKGVDEYTKETIIDKGTGEVLEDIVTKRSVNLEKAEKDAMFDGYFCIVTSELDYTERDIRQIYGGLWRIEQSFRMMKSDLYARPVFVSKNEHIRAHFLICFVALLVLRVFQHLMGDKALSAERITRALNAANCHVFKGGVIHLDDVGGAIAFKKRVDKKGKLVETLAYSNDDEVAQDYKRIQEMFGTDCYNIYLRQEIFNKFLKSIAL